MIVFGGKTQAAGEIDETQQHWGCLNRSLTTSNGLLNHRARTKAFSLLCVHSLHTVAYSLHDNTLWAQQGCQRAASEKIRIKS